MKKDRRLLTPEAPEVIAPELPGQAPEFPVREIGPANRPSRPPTRYRFRFSPLTRVVLLLGLALCLAAIGLTGWNFSDFVRLGDMGNAFEWAKFVLLFGVSTVLFAILLAMLIRSEYVLTDGTLTVVFGLLRGKFELSLIASVHLFKGANKLALYFRDERTRCMAVVIRDDLYNDFIRDITGRNEHILFTFSTAEEEEEAKKK